MKRDENAQLLRGIFAVALLSLDVFIPALHILGARVYPMATGTSCLKLRLTVPGGKCINTRMDILFIVGRGVVAVKLPNSSLLTPSVSPAAVTCEQTSHSPI